MNLPLGELGEVRNGFHLRGAARHNPAGGIQLIQLSDIREGRVLAEGLSRMDLDRIRPKDILRPGDVLLRGRGANYGAAVMPALSAETVAVAPVYVLRLQGNTVKPNYIAWYINRPATQEHLRAQAHGTYIPTVGTQTFAGLEIPVPPLDEQERIAEIDSLIASERALMAELMTARERLADSVLRTLIARHLSGGSAAPGRGNKVGMGEGEEL